MQIELSLKQAEDLINVLASYTEYAADKLEVMQDFPDEYTVDDMRHVEHLRRFAQDLYARVVPLYSKEIADRLYGPDDES